MTGRLQCCVPFCRRTTKPQADWDEWICGDHWRQVRKARRMVYGRFKRRWRRYGTKYGKGGILWRALKREAMERAAGIT